MLYQKCKGETVEEIQDIELTKFYQKIYDATEKNKKNIIKRSVFFTFLNLKSNVRGQLLREATIPSYKINRDALFHLESNNFIRKTETLGNYTITAKGIWEIEQKKNILNITNLLEFLDDKLFNISKFAEKPLSDKQKIVILSMLAIRCFSEDSPLDLKTTEQILNVVKETVDKTYQLLKSLQLISKLNEDDLYGKKGNEHPVSNLFRHTDELPKLTGGLFKAAGNQKYYLDLYNKDQISHDGIKSLFEKIIGEKKLTFIEMEMLSDFCQKISHEKSIFLFSDIKKHVFSKTKFDDVIKDSLMQIA